MPDFAMPTWAGILGAGPEFFGAQPDPREAAIADLAELMRRRRAPQSIDRSPQVNGIYDAVGMPPDSVPPKVGLSDLIARQRGAAPQDQGGGAPPPALPPPVNVPAQPAPAPMLAQGGDGAALPPNAQPAMGAAPAMASPQAAPPQSASSPLARLSQGLADNSDLLLALGSGLVGAPNLAAGAQRAFANAAPLAGQNQTVQALMKFGLNEDMARSAARNPKILNAVLPTLFGTKDKTELVKNYEFARGQGFGGSFLDWIAAQRAGAGEYGLQPIYGTGPDGKPVVLQLGKSGQAVASKLPEGVAVSTGVDKVDLGTHWAMLDKRSGQFLGNLPKDISGKEAQEVVGQAQGKAAANLQATRDNAALTLRSIDSLLNSNDLSRITGIKALIPSIPGTRPSEIEGDLAFVKSRAFLDAYDRLRGAGAITEQEGQAAARAQANLDPKQGEAALRKNLQILAETIRKGLERAEKTAAGAAPKGQAQPSGAAPALPAPSQPGPPQSPALPSGWSVKVQ